jgi:hypothetical protein
MVSFVLIILTNEFYIKTLQGKSFVKDLVVFCMEFFISVNQNKTLHLFTLTTHL